MKNNDKYDKVITDFDLDFIKKNLMMTVLHRR